jgi:hypothetical protein
VTLALDAVVVAGGIFLGRLVARVLRRRRREQTGEAEASRASDAEASRSAEANAPRSSDGTTGPARRRSNDAKATPNRATPPPDAVTLTGFVCGLGDVVVRRLEGDEAWLAGALVFAEEGPVAALFVAPVAGGERAVLVPGAMQTTLAWLVPLAAGDVAVSGDAPQALEHEGAHFERTRRLPVRVQRLGTGAPEVGATAVLGEYSGAGLDRLVVVVGSSAVLAWRGVALSKAEYDVLPGGQSTLAT